MTTNESLLRLVRQYEKLGASEASIVAELVNDILTNDDGNDRLVIASLEELIFYARDFIRYAKKKSI